MKPGTLEPGRAMWTCRKQDNPSVVELLEADDDGSTNAWTDSLETAADDAVEGKVLCVCAALAIARHVHGEQQPLLAGGVAPLTLLEQWIDDPTNERFEQITQLLFVNRRIGVGPLPDRISWWALRVATASVGNYEAGWALRSLCENAAKLGVTPQEMRAHGLRAVSERLT